MTHVFNILCDKMGSMQKAFRCEVNDDCYLKKSTCVIELAASVAIFFWNKFFSKNL